MRCVSVCVCGSRREYPPQITPKMVLLEWSRKQRMEQPLYETVREPRQKISRKDVQNDKFLSGKGAQTKQSCVQPDRNKDSITEEKKYKLCQVTGFSFNEVCIHSEDVVINLNHVNGPVVDLRV